MILCDNACGKPAELVIEYQWSPGRGTPEVPARKFPTCKAGEFLRKAAGDVGLYNG